MARRSARARPTRTSSSAMSPMAASGSISSRQILGQNRLFMNRVTALGQGLADDDWVWVTSHAGRVKAQLKLMDGVNPDTVWTWNAIGKRSGAWNLAADSPEATRGFLLNHLIA